MEDKYLKNYKWILLGKIFKAFIIIGLIGCIGMFIYKLEYDSSAFRIKVLTKDVIKYFKADILTSDKESGKYTLSTKFEESENDYKNTFNLELNGKYFIDKDNNNYYLSLNLNKLKSNNDLINKEVNFEGYLTLDRIYLLLKPIFNNYIYIEEDNNDIINNVNSDDKASLRLSLLNAINNSLYALNTRQSIDFNVKNNNIPTNRIDINMSKYNQINFLNALRDTIYNDNLLLEELAKEYNLSVDELKSSLTNIEFSEDELPDYIRVSIHNTLIGSLFVDASFTISDGDESFGMNINKENGKYVIEVLSNNEILGTMELAKEVDKLDNSNKTSYHITSNMVYDESILSFKADLEFRVDNTPDLTLPKIEDSKNASDLTENDYNSMLENVKKIGPLGELLYSLMSGFNTYDYSK